MSLEVLTPPAGAVTVEDVIAHLRLIEPLDDDELPDADLVQLYMMAAETKVENATGRALSERELLFRCDAFGKSVKLPVAPVIDVTAVTYLDRDGEEQTLADTVYAVLDKLENPRLVLKPGQSWPSTWEIGGAVAVTFTAGWEDPENIPAPLRMAVLQTIGGMYEFREEVSTAQVSELPNGVWSLIADYVRWGA
jgi:uncharacterized phiE125 gp8 family phage protein